MMKYKSKLKIKSTYDLFVLADSYITYLTKKGFAFNDDGYPIFERNMFLDEIPELIVPYSHRKDKRVINKKKTVLCTYAADREIYPRFSNVFEDVAVYKDYSGSIFPDITVTEDMDEEWQDFILLLNQLYAAILAINGIKVVLNTRTGTTTNLKCFKSIPKNVISSSGFLGCKKSDIYDCSYLTKILYILPSKLLIYGKNDKVVNHMLDTVGINYRYYSDFHKLCKGVK